MANVQIRAAAGHQAGGICSMISAIHPSGPAAFPRVRRPKGVPVELWRARWGAVPWCDVLEGPAKGGEESGALVVCIDAPRVLARPQCNPRRRLLLGERLQISDRGVAWGEGRGVVGHGVLLDRLANPLALVWDGFRHVRLPRVVRLFLKLLAETVGRAGGGVGSPLDAPTCYRRNARNPCRQRVQCCGSLPAEVVVLVVIGQASESAGEVRDLAVQVRFASLRGVPSLRGANTLPTLRASGALPVAEHVLGAGAHSRPHRVEVVRRVGDVVVLSWRRQRRRKQWSSSSSVPWSMAPNRGLMRPGVCVKSKAYHTMWWSRGPWRWPRRHGRMFPSV